MLLNWIIAKQELVTQCFKLLLTLGARSARRFQCPPNRP